MGFKIEDYPVITTLSNTDLFDVSEDQGGSVFVSKQLSYADLKTNLGDLNIYGNDGTLTANRTLTMSTFTLDFVGEKFAVDSVRIFKHGTNSTIIGEGAGNFTFLGGNITALGNSTGAAIVNADNCTFIGSQAGSAVTDGDFNTYVGSSSGQFNVTGAKQTGVGHLSLSNAKGDDNTGIGYFALEGHATLFTGIKNVAVGNETGIDLETGAENTLIGYRAGNLLTTGSSNVFIGHSAGSTETTVSDKLVIGNAGTGAAAALITGSFDTGDLQFSNSAITWVDSTKVLTVDTMQLFATNGTTGAMFLGPNAGNTGQTSLQTLAIGFEAGLDLTNGFDNTFIGWLTGANTTTGDNNTFVGAQAGQTNIGGNDNTYIGHDAGLLATGDRNTFVGAISGDAVSSGVDNTAVGYFALSGLSTGQDVTAVGSAAGAISTGNQGTFIGRSAGRFNTSAVGTIGIGYQAAIGHSTTNLTGNHNIGIGYQTYNEATTGFENIAIGYQAMNTGVLTGNNNIAIGKFAGWETTSGSGNVYIGLAAGQNNLTGTDNVFIGKNAGLNETGTGLLIIENSSDLVNPLIKGNFSSGRLDISTNLDAVITAGKAYTGTGTGAHVAGEAYWGNISRIATATDYAIKQDAGGSTTINCRNGTPRILGFAFGNVIRQQIDAANGVFTMNVPYNSAADVIIRGGTATGAPTPFYCDVSAQTNTGAIGIGGLPDASAKLDIQSTSGGLGLPSMSTGQRDAISTPKAGLTIYNNTTAKLNFYNGSAWEAVTSA